MAPGASVSAVSMTRDPDRLVLFTDAVVAIAVTLLILPLVDAVTETRAENLGAVHVITDHKTQIYTFLLSFVVIARFWPHAADPRPQGTRTGRQPGQPA
jgi:uncharacterized membrane protein